MLFEETPERSIDPEVTVSRDSKKEEAKNKSFNQFGVQVMTPKEKPKVLSDKMKDLLFNNKAKGSTNSTMFKPP